MRKIDPSVFTLFGVEEEPEELDTALPTPRVGKGGGVVPPSFATLTEAIAYVQSNLEEGVVCPCCKQVAKLYKRTLNVSMARSLIWLHHQSGTDTLEGAGLWVDVPKIAPNWLLKSREMPKLYHWGLIEEMAKDPGDTTRRTSGLWRPTEKGVQFVQCLLQVPKRVYLYNNEILGWDDQTVTIRDALGTKFDYAELMGAV